MLYSQSHTFDSRYMADRLSTILVADDHPLFREAMRDVVVDAFPQAKILEASSLTMVSETVQADDSVELILLDLNMPGMNGFAGFISLRNSQPAIPIVLVTAEQDANVMREAESCGAAGFIGKSLSRKEMIKALHQVAAGDVYFPDAGQYDGASDTLFTTNVDEELANRISQLTQQQRKVLELVASGLANKVIAYELGITESTVKAHVSAILRKLNVYSRTQLALIVNSTR